MPELRLTHIVTSSPERAHAAQLRYPEAKITPSADALFARDSEFDAVVIASPNDSHAPLAIRALELERGVVVDKPFAATAADGERIVATAQQRGLFCSVFQSRRWDGDFLTVRRLLAEGRLGNVHRIESRFDRWRPRVDASKWREHADPALAGGLLFDLGSHLVDQAMVLFGPAVSVYGEVVRRRPGAVVDDDVFIALQHSGGATSHLWASVLSALPGPRFRVLGDRASYVVNGLDPQEAHLRAGMVPGDPGFGEAPEQDWGTVGAGGEVAAEPTEPGRYREFYVGVARSMSGEQPPPVDPADSVRVLQVLQAARRSWEESRVVRLD